MTHKRWMSLGLWLTIACGGSSTSTSAGSETDPDPSTSTSTGGSASTTAETADPDDASTSSATTDGTEASEDASTGEPGEPADFVVRLENISDASALPTAFSPGVWVEQSGGSAPLFQLGLIQPGIGLEALAEDGDPSVVARALAGADGVVQLATFDTPQGASAPGVLLPGEVYEFGLTAQAGSRLAVATMLTGSNDIFAGTGPHGISLFASDGLPEPARDVSELFALWDAGTEFNQPPSMGGYQANQQSAPNLGSSEAGQVGRFLQSTRALPLARALARVDVDIAQGVFSFTIENLDAAIATPLSNTVVALHNDSVSLFSAGSSAAEFPGLEALAEDGNAAAWEANLDGVAGVASAVVVAGAAPGGAITFAVAPEPSVRFLSFATMLVHTNDAFLAPAEGVALLDPNGTSRSAIAIEADIERLLGVWDAGTEANQVPGAGSNTAVRQSVPNTGPADPVSTIRYYSDNTNDLGGESVGGFADVTIINGAVAGEFEVTLRNTSGNAFPGVLSPLVYLVHPGIVGLFDEGSPASPGLELLAELGSPFSLSDEIPVGTAVVHASGVIDTPDVAGGTGPLGLGDAYTFTITATASAPFFTFASMVVPSNDTFVSLGGTGISLFDGATPLEDSALADAVAVAFSAWDAGTEANQAGASGRDMAPFQTNSTAGFSEGTRVVREANSDPVWAYPAARQLLRVTVAPVAR